MTTGPAQERKPAQEARKTVTFLFADIECIAHLHVGPYRPKSVILVKHRHANVAKISRYSQPRT